LSKRTGILVCAGVLIVVAMIAAFVGMERMGKTRTSVMLPMDTTGARYTDGNGTHYRTTVVNPKAPPKKHERGNLLGAQ